MNLPLVWTKEAADEATGRDLPEELFNFHPWGRRIVIVRKEPQQMTKGGLFIPDQAQDRETEGWIIALGPDVGAPGSNLPVGGAPFIHRERLLGMKVLFGQYAGQPLLLGEGNETLFESDYTILTDGDIWGTIE